MKLKTLVPLAAALLPMMAPLPSGAADTLGQKPVTVIIPLVPGGANDAELRLYFDQLSGKLLPQQFTMDFKPGAAGTIGGAYVARSAPDGHTLQMISSSFTTIPAMIKDLTFDTMKDFTHISQMSLKQFVLVVHPSMPVKTMPEYISYARANPGKINWGTTGSGGSAHLAGAWLDNLINAQSTFVHYKGSAQTQIDLVAGRIDSHNLSLQQSLPLIKAGKLRAIALMSSTRSDVLPGVPAITEFVPGYSFVSYIGLSGPAGMPAGVVKQLHDAFVKAVKAPEVVKVLESQGSMPVGSSPAEFTRLLQSETDRWKKVVKDNNIPME